MDPPSFTKNHLQKTLMLENGNALEELHKMMEEKGTIIDQKLNKYETKISGDQDELKMTRSEPPFFHNLQIVPFFSHPIKGSELGPSLTGSTSFTETPQFYKRNSFEGGAYLAQVKTDPDGVISLSDVDDQEIDEMILSESEQRLKKVIWNNLNSDWLKEQRDKKRLRKEQAKIKKAQSKRAPKIKRESIKIEANNPIDAITQAPKLKNVIDVKYLSSLFKTDSFVQNAK